jgi:hypothetical protein
MKIDLRDDLRQVRKLIRDGQATFEAEHPEVRWSCVALDTSRG